MNVLLFSVSVGAGHLKAAEAIKEEVEKRYPQAKILIVDTLKYINPIMDKLIVNGYLGTLKNTPILYKKLYELADNLENTSEISQTLNRLLSKRIKKLINEFNPDIIVCTHPIPLQMISQLKNKKKINLPLVGILTDYNIHSFWLHKHVDAYIVAHEYMKEEMIKKNIPSGTIHSSGIPVLKKFTVKKDKKELLKELGLEDKETFLIMGGILGIGEIKNTFSTLLKWEKDIQIILSTGKNMKLKKQLEDLASESNKKVKILGFTNRIDDYMEVADYVMSKPGGMTITESLVKGKPLIIISPIPGQEERNAQFLTNIGVAIRLYDNDEMDNLIYQVLDNPFRVSQIKEMAKMIAKPNSSIDAVDVMEKLI